MDRYGTDGVGGGLREELRLFLRAEAAGEEARSEAALGKIFAALPAVEPRPDFAARVMVLIEASPLRSLPGGLRQAARDLPPAFRWPLAAALALAGCAAFYLLPAAVLLCSRLEPGSVLQAGHGFWVASFERLAAMAWVFQVFRQLLEAIFEIAASPPFLLVAFGSAAVATVLSRCLWLLLEPSRRSSDAAFR